MGPLGRGQLSALARFVLQSIRLSKNHFQWIIARWGQEDSKSDMCYAQCRRRIKRETASSPDEEAGLPLHNPQNKTEGEGRQQEGKDESPWSESFLSDLWWSNLVCCELSGGTAADGREKAVKTTGSVCEEEEACCIVLHTSLVEIVWH